MMPKLWKYKLKIDDYSQNYKEMMKKYLKNWFKKNWEDDQKKIEKNRRNIWKNLNKITKKKKKKMMKNDFEKSNSVKIIQKLWENYEKCLKNCLIRNDKKIIKMLTK